MQELLVVFLPGHNSALREDRPSATEHVEFYSMLISVVTTYQTGLNFWDQQYLVRSKVA